MKARSIRILALLAPIFYTMQVKVLMLALSIILQTISVNAILPSATIDIYSNTKKQKESECLSSNFLHCLTPVQTFDASRAFFGMPLHFDKPDGYDYDNRPRPLVAAPNYDPLLCSINYPSLNQVSSKSPSSSSKASSSFTPSYTKIFDGKIVLVPRGQCDFERKALNAQRLGAHGVIIYNTLESRYDVNTTNGIVWPVAGDYGCHNGETWIPKEYFSFSPLPYNATVNDPLLGGGWNGDGDGEDGYSYDESECDVGSDCKSQRCLLTGRSRIRNEIFDNEYMQACCAWDLHMDLGPSRNIHVDMVNIPITFITMRDGDELSYLVKKMEEKANTDNADKDDDSYYLFSVMYEKGFPKWNLSSYLMWIMGVFTVWYGSWQSARDLRKTRYLLETVDIAQHHSELIRGGGDYYEERNSNRFQRYDDHYSNSHHDVVGNHQSTSTAVQIEMMDDVVRNDNDVPTTYDDRNNAEYNVITNTESNESQNQNDLMDQDDDMDNDHDLSANRQQTDNINTTPSEEDSQYYYDGFQHSASSFDDPTYTGEPSLINSGAFFLLITLVFFVMILARVYVFMRLFYSLIAIFASIKVLTYPLFRSIGRYIGGKTRIGSLLSNRCKFCCIDSFSWIDILSIGSGVGLGITWIRFAFIVAYAEDFVFYWILKDLFGICVCILIIDLVRFDNIKIISFFLVVSFMYDVFIQFFTIFKTNLYHDPQPTTTSSDDHEFCEKYPEAVKCIEKGVPFPMILSIPLINDYRNENTTLSLSDIIIPGLLLGFCARLDASKLLLASVSTRRRAARRGVTTNVDDFFQTHHRRTKRKRWFSGYLIWLTISYAVALLLAYISASIRNVPDSEPLFLLIAPLLLITISYLGRRKRELSLLWEYYDTMYLASRVVQLSQILGPELIGIVSLNDNDDDTVSEGSSNSSIGELENNNQRDEIVLA